MTVATIPRTLHAGGSPAPAVEPPDGAVIRLDGISKRFPARRGWLATLRHPRRTAWVPVLQNVSLAVQPGESFGLLGPNGAGKTTLFKILSTLVLPDAGRATVLGHDVVRDGRQVRRVLSPVIADERSLHWRLSARDNLDLYAALQGLRGGAARTRVNDLLHVVGLTDTGGRMVGAFSSGMRQRLLIARALVGEPRVLLLDEPTRSLDPVSARSFRAFLRDEIAGRQKCTILLATHNAEEALELCGRVAILDHGRVLAAGTSDHLIREMDEGRYRLWTRDAASPLLVTLARSEAVEDLAPEASAETDADGWSCVTMRIRGGPDAAALVLASLVLGGLEVSRFERVGVSLADLIARTIERGGSYA